jgi:stage IV sporulation protein A
VAASIYEDIARRTGGNIYLGVVGPVRTGKSTFIKRFMESLVIPNIENVYLRERAVDELPQSGSGRTITTAEPKFVPEEAVNVSLDGGAKMSVRLVDCVGYMIPGAIGQLENGAERMVTTPWYDVEIPLTRAAEEGTRRVIAEHSTIGIVMTTDGSICGIPREDYVDAETRVINELREIGKPFVVVLNSADPTGETALSAAREIEQRHGVSCVCANCAELDRSGIEKLISKALGEFPVSEVGVYLPSWVEALPAQSGVKAEVLEQLRAEIGGEMRLCGVADCADRLCGAEKIETASITELDAGTGSVSIKIELPGALYYATVSEECGYAVSNDAELMSLLSEMGQIRREYDKISAALHQARETGYGVVMPDNEDMLLQEPEIVSRAGKYTVRLKASAPSLHMIMTNVETEVSPALGGEQASEEIMSFLLQGLGGDVSRLWDSNIFGRSLYDIAEESLSKKITDMSGTTQTKLRETVERIVNDGGKRLICIIF